VHRNDDGSFSVIDEPGIEGGLARKTGWRRCSVALCTKKSDTGSLSPTGSTCRLRRQTRLETELTAIDRGRTRPFRVGFHSGSTSRKVLVGCAVVVIAGRAVGSRCPAVCFDVTDSPRRGLVVSLRGPFMCLRGPAMLFGCRQIRSASADMGFFGAPLSAGDIVFADGLAGGEFGAQTGELLDPICRALKCRCLNAATIYLARKLIRVAVRQPHRLVAIRHIRSRPPDSDPQVPDLEPLRFMVVSERLCR
jgi:hypothetical protein